MRVAAVLAAVAILAGCNESPEQKLRRQLASQTTGVIVLPAGVIRLQRELVLAPGAHDLEIAGSGTLLKTDPGFEGRAVIVAEGARNVKLHDFSIDGGRNIQVPGKEMVPPENALRVWYDQNGVLADRVDGLEIAHLNLANIVNFAVLVSRSSKIRMANITVDNAGSKNAKGRNNLSGGILIEEGSRDFEVRESHFRRILGNGLWTHSLRTSPRLEDGLFSGNRFEEIGRDALQVGHATRVRVENNTGERIGYPVGVVDVENGGTPVAIDTAGNVDRSEYSRNFFEEVNGKCMDLDGFHDGAIRENRCFNRLRPDDYAFGHFGIVMNNSDPSVRVRNIEISKNVIDGAKFGGLFLMGSGHRIADNRFLHVNTAQCPDSSAKFACVYVNDQPKMLSAGIYLSRGVARLEDVTGNVIERNEIIGHKMRANCVVAGPGVKLSANTVGKNDCSDEIVKRR